MSGSMRVKQRIFFWLMNWKRLFLTSQCDEPKSWEPAVSGTGNSRVVYRGRSLTIGQYNNKKGRAMSVFVKQQMTDARRTSISSSTAAGVFGETFFPGLFGNLNMSVTIERDQSVASRTYLHFVVHCWWSFRGDVLSGQLRQFHIWWFVFHAVLLSRFPCDIADFILF